MVIVASRMEGDSKRCHGCVKSVPASTQRFVPCKGGKGVPGRDGGPLEEGDPAQGRREESFAAGGLPRIYLYNVGPLYNFWVMTDETRS